MGLCVGLMLRFGMCVFSLSESGFTGFKDLQGFKDFQDYRDRAD